MSSVHHPRPAACTARVRKAQSARARVDAPNHFAALAVGSESARARVGCARSLSKTPRSGFHHNWPHPLFAHRVRENRPVAGAKARRRRRSKSSPSRKNRLAAESNKEKGKARRLHPPSKAPSCGPVETTASAKAPHPPLNSAPHEGRCQKRRAASHLRLLSKSAPCGALGVS